VVSVPFARRCQKKRNWIEERIRESKFLAQIEAEGELKNARAYVPRLLGLRFGPEKVAEFSDALNAINNLDKLSELFTVAAKCRGLGPFRKALAPKM
jgi:hypothetical protein